MQFKKYLVVEKKNEKKTKFWPGHFFPDLRFQILHILQRIKQYRFSQILQLLMKFLIKGRDIQ